MTRNTIHSLFWTMIQRIGVFLQEFAQRRLSDPEIIMETIKKGWL